MSRFELDPVPTIKCLLNRREARPRGTQRQSISCDWGESLGLCIGFCFLFLEHLSTNSYSWPTPIHPSGLMQSFLSPSHSFICLSCWHSCSKYSAITVENRKGCEGDWRQGYPQTFKGTETTKALFGQSGSSMDQDRLGT